MNNNKGVLEMALDLTIPNAVPIKEQTPIKLNMREEFDSSGYVASKKKFMEQLNKFYYAGTLEYRASVIQALGNWTREEAEYIATEIMPWSMVFKKGGSLKRAL